MNTIKNIPCHKLVLFLVMTFYWSTAAAQTTVLRLFEEAEVLMEKGKYKTAIEKYDSIILFQPANPKLYYNRASAFIFQQKYGKAIVDLNKSISLDSSYYDAYFNRAYVYSFLKNDAFAVGDYDIYLSKFPNDSEALLARGKILMEQGEYDLAITDFKRYSSQGKQNDEVYLALYFAYLAKQDTNQAIIYLDSALLVNPSKSAYNKIKGDIYFDKGQYETACISYDNAIASNRGDINLYIAKAEAKAASGLYNDAAYTIKKAISYKPNSAELHYDLGFYLFSSKRYQEALKEGKIAEELKYDDSKSLYEIIAVCHNNLGNAQEACNYFKKAINAGSKEAQKWYLSQGCEEEE